MAINWYTRLEYRLKCEFIFDLVVTLWLFFRSANNSPPLSSLWNVIKISPTYQSTHFAQYRRDNIDRDTTCECTINMGAILLIGPTRNVYYPLSVAQYEFAINSIINKYEFLFRFRVAIVVVAFARNRFVDKIHRNITLDTNGIQMTHKLSLCCLPHFHVQLSSCTQSAIY